MNQPVRGLISLCLLVTLITPARAQDALPTGAVWTEHVRKDLLPFWTAEAALGNPVGAFPTPRCNNGALYSQNNPCPEIGRHPGMLERSVVALSRQSYGYGVAFHLTGDR